MKEMGGKGRGSWCRDPAWTPKSPEVF